MKMLAFIGVLFTIALLLGAVVVPDKRPAMLTIGGLLLVFWVFVIPLARRRGKI